MFKLLGFLSVPGTLLFLGGAATAVAVQKCASSTKTREVAVKAMGVGLAAYDSAKEKAINIKEDAEDMLEEARAEKEVFEAKCAVKKAEKEAAKAEKQAQEDELAVQVAEIVDEDYV